MIGFQIFVEHSSDRASHPTPEQPSHSNHTQSKGTSDRKGPIAGSTVQRRKLIEIQCRPRKARRKQRVSIRSQLSILSFSFTNFHLQPVSQPFSEKKDADLDGMPITLPEDRIKYLESQTQALEQQLAYRAEATAEAVAEVESIQEKLIDATAKLEEEKDRSMDMARSMTRQYKGMQEDLLNKINEREREMQSLRDELETLKVTHKEDIAQKNSEIQQNDADIKKQTFITENLCRRFTEILADARIKIINHAQANDAESSGSMSASMGTEDRQHHED